MRKVRLNLSKCWKSLFKRLCQILVILFLFSTKCSSAVLIGSLVNGGSTMIQCAKIKFRNTVARELLRNQTAIYICCPYPQTLETAR